MFTVFQQAMSQYVMALRRKHSWREILMRTVCPQQEPKCYLQVLKQETDLFMYILKQTFAFLLNMRFGNFTQLMEGPAQ